MKHKLPNYMFSIFMSTWVRSRSVHPGQDVPGVLLFGVLRLHFLRPPATSCFYIKPTIIFNVLILFWADNETLVQ